MYDWKTLRLLAAVLLMAPLVHFALLAGFELSRYLSASPDVWNAEMAALIEADQDAALPFRPVVVVGGQRVRLWSDLPHWLAPRDVLMRPLGDASLEDLAHHYPRLVAYYQPSVLVVFPGYADLHLRSDKSPEDFQRELRALLDLDAQYLGATRRVVITPPQMPLHPGDRERIDAIAQRLKALATVLPRVEVIDPNPLLRGADGRPDPAYFRSDGVNLSAAGYARLSALLKARLASTYAAEGAARQVF